MRDICILGPMRYLAFLLIAASAFLSSCALGPGGDDANNPLVIARNVAIRAEPRGDYYIGRRYVVNKTRFWGYLRRPGQLWEEAPLAIIDERGGVRQPDRLPEAPTDGSLAHGYDHNAEYKVWGRFTGQIAYDPNGDMELPLFRASRFELLNARPGFLFGPSDRYDPRYIPYREAKRTTPERL